MALVEKSLIPKGKKYANLESREDYLQMKKEIKDINDKNEVKRIIDRFLANSAEEDRLKAEQDRINAEAKKRDEAAGLYGGGMGKSRTGHTDYRKGGMVYTRKNK